MEHPLMVWAQSVKQLCTKSVKPLMDTFHLSVPEIGILLFLVENPVYDTCGDLAEQLLLAKPNVSTTVEQLVRKNFLARETDQTDRRKIHLKPLPPALELARQGRAAQDQMLHDLLDDFTPDEIDQMRGVEQKLLDRIRAILKKT